jgi:hypothetical protein
LVENTTIITNMRKLMMSAGQKRRRVRGTSMKRLNRSTFFFVAPHVMLYEKRCARRWRTYKNGIQIMFSYYGLAAAALHSLLSYLLPRRR